MSICEHIIGALVPEILEGRHALATGIGLKQESFFRKIVRQPVGHFRVSQILWERPHDIQASTIDIGVRARDVQRSARIHIRDPRQLPSFDNPGEPTGTVGQQQLVRTDWQFKRSISSEIVSPMRRLKGSIQRLATDWE